ncbi:hypothetical protein [Methanococcoides methylutens]|uniref:hypothetical protein n=1 Tax=Methanococcoides methylutens TaxID=2226 RepID=UPI001364222F|nr:hypothetical protein [Methanococcoides methylutens]
MQRCSALSRIGYGGAGQRTTIQSNTNEEFIVVPDLPAAARSGSWPILKTASTEIVTFQ